MLVYHHSKGMPHEKLLKTKNENNQKCQGVLSRLILQLSKITTANLGQVFFDVHQLFSLSAIILY